LNQLGTYPTPVERLPSLSRPNVTLWVKRDDRTSAVYGGNKVRKLERLLGDALARRPRRIVTVGAAGSHHVLATAIWAREQGIELDAVLVPQIATRHVVENLRAVVHAGVRVLAASSYPHAALRVLGRIGRGDYHIPVGGSNLLGTLAYVDAARELAAQVRAGDLPEPDIVLVALGSGGTAAGLAAGFALERMKTRIVAVTVSEPVWWIARRVHALARAAVKHEARRAREAVPQTRLVVDQGYLGTGYGHATAAGERALAMGAGAGLTLDLTYTAKTFAATLDRVTAGGDANVLYWHTLSSAPMDRWLEGAPSETALAPELRRLLLSGG
jgi:1-aminocyclopropane-1-carboxylate deaminase/D-cysteine desulfhydrase-like pyridoxal-dependent ACC family enzyme